MLTCRVTGTTKIRAAFQAMRAETMRAALIAATTLSETAQETAAAKAPTYRGVDNPRTSVNAATGKPYVQENLLREQIRAKAVRVRGGAVGMVGLLPADGTEDRMVPYWQLLNYGIASKRHFRSIIRPRHKTRLMFPAAAWPGGTAKKATLTKRWAYGKATARSRKPTWQRRGVAGDHAKLYQSRRGGQAWTFKWVYWSGTTTPHYFMQAGDRAARSKMADTAAWIRSRAMRKWRR